MDLGVVPSGRMLPPDSSATNEIAKEDSEILRRLVRLLSKSEEDELYAQDARRQPSSSALHTLYRSKSEGDTTSVHLNRSRSVPRLAETAPLRISRLPKIDLAENFKDFEKSSSKLRAKLVRFQNVFRRMQSGSAVSKAAAKMAVYLENVTNYTRQQVGILVQAETGPPSEVHARNLSSSLSGLAHSARALERLLNELREGGLLDDDEDEDLHPLEHLAQLAESESRSLKDSKADESLKRMSGIRFRQHSVELSSQFAEAFDDAAFCLSEFTKCAILALRDRKGREGNKHLLRTAIAVLFSIISAVMVSGSIQRESSRLDLAVNGIWLVSLACGVASSITGIIGVSFSDSLTSNAHPLAGKAITCLARGNEILFLLAATLFSVGLCVFAFSSSQATAVRVIVTVFTSLHFTGLFALFVWLARSHRSEKSKRNDHHGSFRTWPSMRRIAQLSIHATSNAANPDNIRMKDVEHGLHPRKSSFKHTTPIIHVTDTEQEVSTPAFSSSMNREQNHDHAADQRPATIFNLNPNTDVGDADSDSASHHDLTSLSFSHSHAHTLTVPSARRLSSDSSRSLPALPADVQVARAMAYGPNGMFLCIGNGNTHEHCTIFSTDSPDITLGELKPTDIARQIEWSADGQNILLRLTHMIYVWNAMPTVPTRRPAIIIHQDSDNVKWLTSSDSFLTCKGDILTSFHIDGTPTGVFQIPASSIQDFVVTQDGHRIICLVSNLGSARSGKTSTSTQKLIVYNLDHKAVEQITPVGRDALSIVRATVSSDLVLVNFGGTTPPQVWRYQQNTDASERRTSATFLSFRRAMSFKAPSGRFSGYGIFGSADDKLILSLGEEGDMFIFASNSGHPLRHITTNASHSDRRSLNVNDSGARLGRPVSQCVAWDPDILAFTVCMGHADGSIWQWKIPFDEFSQDTASFTVNNLGDEESTLIRPADINKVEQDGTGGT